LREYVLMHAWPLSALACLPFSAPIMSSASADEQARAALAAGQDATQPAGGSSTDSNGNGSSSANGVPAASPSPSSAILAAFSEPKDVQQCAAAKAAQEANEPKKEEELLWYFAIGSMINLTSMNLRNLFPRQSMPGVLHGWKLVFRGVGGMGDIEEAAGESFHGVLHQLTCAEFQHLDSIEAVYKRTPVVVDTYDGRKINAFAYKMDPSKMGPQTQPDSLPGERYLDIITRGCRHFGVSEEYIKWLEKVPTVPRKKPEEYRTVPAPPPVVISAAELAAGVGATPYDPAVPLLVSINGKVLQWVVTPDTPGMQMMYSWSQKRYAGTDCTVMVAKTLYEPMFPIPTTYEAMPPVCRGWAEDLFIGFTLRQGGLQDGRRLGAYEVIGWLEGRQPEELKDQAPRPFQQPKQQEQQNQQQEQQIA